MRRGVVWFGLEFLFAVRFACGEVGKLLSARFNFGMVFVWFALPSPGSSPGLSPGPFLGSSHDVPKIHLRDVLLVALHSKIFCSYFRLKTGFLCKARLRLSALPTMSVLSAAETKRLSQSENQDSNGARYSCVSVVAREGVLEEAIKQYP